MSSVGFKSKGARRKHRYGFGSTIVPESDPEASPDCVGVGILAESGDKITTEAGDEITTES